MTLDYAVNLAMSEDTDEDLVVRAQGGDRAAFDAIVNRHRERAMMWAVRLTKDPHLAEDVLQDAWVRAYTQITSLAYPSRFWNWFRRIVHNQAMMLLRRGGPYRKEYPLSSWVANLKVEAWLTDDEYLYQEQSATHLQAEEPSTSIIQSEEAKNIENAMVECLKPRDYIILRAHWMEEVSLSEISKQFSLSMSNTYQVISRSRVKLRKHLVQSALVGYIQSRRRQVPHVANRVEPLLYAGEFWSSAGFCLSWALQYSDSCRWTVAEIMGLSGHAFHLCVKQDSVDISGTFAYDWGEKFTQGLYNLGFEARYVGDNGIAEPLPYKHVDAIHLIHKSVDRGMPAVIWEAKSPFFGLVTSYQDETSSFQVLGFDGCDTIPYADLGKGPYANLFVLSIGRMIHVDRLTALKRALITAIEHGRSKDRPQDGYSHGLQAYDVWIEALQSHRVNAAGNAFNAAMLAEARTYASEFLTNISRQGMQKHSRQRRIKRLSMYAAAQYAVAAQSVREVRKLFPFPTFGNPADSHVTEVAINHLREAKKAEARALRALEYVVQDIDRH